MWALLSGASWWFEPGRALSSLYRVDECTQKLLEGSANPSMPKLENPDLGLFWSLQFVSVVCLNRETVSNSMIPAAATKKYKLKENNPSVQCMLRQSVWLPLKPVWTYMHILIIWKSLSFPALFPNICLSDPNSCPCLLTASSGSGSRVVFPWSVLLGCCEEELEPSSPAPVPKLWAVLLLLALMGSQLPAWWDLWGAMWYVQKAEFSEDAVGKL